MSILYNYFGPYLFWSDSALPFSLLAEIPVACMACQCLLTLLNALVPLPTLSPVMLWSGYLFSSYFKVLGLFSVINLIRNALK